MVLRVGSNPPLVARKRLLSPDKRRLGCQRDGLCRRRCPIVKLPLRVDHAAHMALAVHHAVDNHLLANDGDEWDVFAQPRRLFDDFATRDLAPFDLWRKDGAAPQFLARLGLEHLDLRAHHVVKHALAHCAAIGQRDQRVFLFLAVKILRHAHMIPRRPIAIAANRGGAYLIGILGVFRLKLVTRHVVKHEAVARVRLV